MRYYTVMYSYLDILSMCTARTSYGFTRYVAKPWMSGTRQATTKIDIRIADQILVLARVNQRLLFALGSQARPASHK